MMPMHKRLASLFLLLCLGGLVCAQEQVIWLHTDIYPYIISQGPQAGTGAADHLMDTLSKSMADLSFIREAVPNARLLEELRKGRRVLHPTSLKSPEREAFMYFSRPYVILKSPGLVVLNDQAAPGFDQLARTVDLGLIAQDPGITLAAVRERRYGGALDQALGSLPAERLVLVPSLKEDLPRMLELLRKKRISAIVGYEDELRALLALKGLGTDGLAFLSPKGSDPYLFACVGAPRNAWGKAIIERIDSLLPQALEGVALRYSYFLAEESRKGYLDESKLRLAY